MLIRYFPETKETKTYKTLQEASKDIKTRLDDWKVQLNIAYAIVTSTKAYKSYWRDEK